ncbi:MAG: choloylglycine hydrolase, partial [Actinomycetota bacterium]|nr:choloylglycine hydrolase [Actinomycetota bacterium]
RNWTSSYGIVGIAAVTDTGVMDGMNEAGVSGHGLYMAGFCDYQQPKNDGKDLSEADVIAYLLATCGSIEEIKRAAADLTICGFDPGIGFIPPLHFLFHDKTASLALEMRPEGLSVVDNPVGVGTNPPYLDWHMTNVRQYAGLSATNPTTKIDGFTLEPLGQGGGLRGLPGDYTPPGRFVRALVQVALADEASDSAAAEMSALHILNSFDINSGLIREIGPTGQPSDEVTVWSTIANLTGGRWSYRLRNDPTINVVDVATTDFTSSRSLPLPDTQIGSFVPKSI